MKCACSGLSAPPQWGHSEKIANRFARASTVPPWASSASPVSVTPPLCNVELGGAVMDERSPEIGLPVVDGPGPYAPPRTAPLRGQPLAAPRPIDVATGEDLVLTIDRGEAIPRFALFN